MDPSFLITQVSQDASSTQYPVQRTPLSNVLMSEPKTNGHIISKPEFICDGGMGDKASMRLRFLPNRVFRRPHQNGRGGSQCNKPLKFFRTILCCVHFPRPPPTKMATSTGEMNKSGVIASCPNTNNRIKNTGNHPLCSSPSCFSDPRSPSGSISTIPKVRDLDATIIAHNGHVAGPTALCNGFPGSAKAPTANGGGCFTLLPSVDTSEAHKLCVVIDLDETLVHSSFKPVQNADYVVPVNIDNIIHHVYVMKRPHVDTFLQEVGERFECILFTASLAKYADPVADLLDKRRVFRSRLFREACVFHQGNYVKDLNRLGRDTEKVVIIDNSPASYIFHPQNAIPISSWFGDSMDRELLNLLPILDKVHGEKDVTKVLAQEIGKQLQQQPALQAPS